MDTDRETIARRLADIPYCIIPRTVRVAGAVLTEAASNREFGGFSLPLLVRVAGTHGGDEFDKAEKWDDIVAFVSKNLEATYYLIEYVDYRSNDGLFRKYRIIFIDEEIFPYPLPSGVMRMNHAEVSDL
jgi:hypothetical protein